MDAKRGFDASECYLRVLLPLKLMIDWIKGLPAPLRYSAYVAGVLLAFMVAAGMGATAALVVDRQHDPSPERAASASGDPDGRGKPEGTTLKGTAVEETTDGSNGARTGGASYVASFVHRATKENSRGDYTYIGDPSIDGDPEAVVLAAPADTGGDGATYPHNIGVWYEGAAKKWAIFDQDRAPVPAETTFEVRVPRATGAFVHSAAPANTLGSFTYLDDPLTDGEPGAVLSVTQNWNPGGGRGVYNDHPIGVVYDQGVDQWAIYNEDGAPIPDGAAFNVAVSGGGRQGK
jgi:hypothetical protein